MITVEEVTNEKKVELSTEKYSGEIHRGSLFRLRSIQNHHHVLSTVICVLSEEFLFRLFDPKAPYKLKLERNINGYHLRVPDRHLKKYLSQVTPEEEKSSEEYTYLLLYNPIQQLHWTENPMVFSMEKSYKDIWFTTFEKCMKIVSNGYQLTMVIPDLDIYFKKQTEPESIIISQPEKNTSST